MKRGVQEDGAARERQGLMPLLAWAARPMDQASASARAVTVSAGVVVGMALAVLRLPKLGLSRIEGVFHSPDSSHYLAIAAGRTSEVMQPFAARQLGALLSGLPARLGVGTVRQGFLAESAVALAVTLGVTLWLMMGTRAPRWMAAALVVVPFWGELTQSLVLPDLWYAALVAVLLWLLAKEWMLAAALMVLPLMLSRESTSLTLVCLLLACWGQMRWAIRGAAVASFVAGGVIVSRLAAGAQPNVEHLPAAVYLLAKVPWNFLRNVLGVMPWSNVNMDLCRVPAWSMPLHLGNVQSVGVCGVSFGQQLLALEVTLSAFGLLPLVLAISWWRERRTRQQSAVLRFSLLYGAACFVLAPVLGAGFQHLVGYAWPLFLVAGPMLLGRMMPRSLSGRAATASVGVLGLHLALCAMAGWMSVWPKIAVEAAMWAMAWWLMRIRDEPSERAAGIPRREAM